MYNSLTNECKGDGRSTPSRGGEGSRNMAAGTTTQAGRRSGLSLLELLIVMAILSVLVGSIYGIYDTSVKQARINSMRTKLRILKKAIDQYYGAHGTYPPSLESLTKRYITTIPDDPMTEYEGNDWWIRGPLPSDPWLPATTDTMPAHGIYDVMSSSGIK